jgi:signal transduction histidine kinase
MPGALAAGTTGEGRRTCPDGGDDQQTGRTGLAARLLGSCSVMALAFLPTAAWSQGSGAAPTRMALGTVDVLHLAMFAGITGAAMLSAIWLIRERGRTAAENIELRGRMADLAAALQRSDALLNLRDQRVLVWFKDDRRAELVGSLDPGSGAPEDRATFLAFGRWLNPRSAGALENALSALRENGTVFDLVVETSRSTLLEVQGRRAPGYSAARFLSLTQARHEHAQLKLAHQELRRNHDSLLGLLDALDMPFWVRESDGRLAWVNGAYAEAVEAPQRDTATAEGRELLGSGAREAIAGAHAASQAVVREQLSTVISGDRRVLAVTDVAGPSGSAGMAGDMTEMATLREEFDRTVRSHAETLDQLNTAVAIFDTDQKLRFHNHAFLKLWELDTAFLESAPDHAILLDRLRSEGRIAEQPEWRRWKENLLSAYRSVEPQEHWWHLPDGQTLRVVANPQPRGGVTWLFENLTEKINLESRYNTAVRVQGETLDNLAEGVAVFGPDGRVRLSNPAFSTLWSLPDGLVKPGTHISVIRAACQEAAEASPWGDLVAAVTGFDERRSDIRGQVELKDGNVLRYAVIHLPNGQVMTTFVDVTDSVNVARALKDRNEALERADRLKNDFVQHVSYELRSPLTNIIGFTELLSQQVPGPLNERQSEYVEHIGSSSAVLLTIVNDILDLATVDAGIMRLDIAEVPVERTVRDAAELVAERLRDHRLSLDVDVSGAPATFLADEHRVRQILAHLLSNAANFAPEGGTIRLSCSATPAGVQFVVHDDGPGMPAETLDGIFRRFERRANGGRRRGAGLGLSIVKSFVELHGGSVEIESAPGKGTTVTCRFPVAPDGMRVAAE